MLNCMEFLKVVAKYFKNSCQTHVCIILYTIENIHV